MVGPIVEDRGLGRIPDLAFFFFFPSVTAPGPAEESEYLRGTPLPARGVVPSKSVRQISEPSFRESKTWNQKAE